MTDQPIATRLDAPASGRYIAYDRTNNRYAYFYMGLHLGHAPTYQQADEEITRWLLAVMPIKEER